MKIGVFGRKGGEESENPKTASPMNLMLLNSKKSTLITERAFNSGEKSKTSICCWSVFGNSNLETSSQQPGIGSFDSQQVLFSP